VLAVCYGESDLEPYYGNYDLDVVEWQNDKVISLREAAHLFHSHNLQQATICSCKSECHNNKCLCVRSGNSCLSKCHGGKRCNNNASSVNLNGNFYL
jgi:hypothetical protein